MQQTATRPIRIAEPSMHPLHFHIADFLHAKATKAPKTQAFYELALRLYRDHVGRHWPPTDSSINSFLAACKQRGCRDSTVHDYFTAIRAWCNWLHRRGKIGENPIDFVETPRRPKILPRAPRAADVARLFEVLEAAAKLGKWNHVRDKALFNLLYETGMRVGEAVSLEIGDLSPRFGAAVLRNTKTDEDRVAVFDEETGRDILRWLRLREGMQLPADLQIVFISQHRRYQTAGPLTGDGVRHALRRWCQRAGISPIHPHALRHAHAIHYLRAGGDLLDLQKQLGHHNLSTTQRYTKCLGAGRRERHARHSPRTNLSQIVADETIDDLDLYLLITDQATQTQD